MARKMTKTELGRLIDLLLKFYEDERVGPDALGAISQVRSLAVAIEGEK